MLKEWDDKLPTSRAVEMWRARMEEELAQRVAQIESDLRKLLVSQDGKLPGFFAAMRGFFLLRETMFPGFPVDPATKILLTLADTPAGTDRASVTSIAVGAEVPLATALRYVAALEAQGIIERVQHEHDGRRTILKLTDEGQRRLDEIAGRWTKRYLCVVGGTLMLTLACRAFGVA